MVIAGFTAYSSWEKVGLQAEDAKVALSAIQWLLIGVGLFLLMNIVSSIASWWDNRNAECDLFDEVIRPGYRERPSWKGIWRWYETWLFITVIVFIGGMVIFIDLRMLPKIN